MIRYVETGEQASVDPELQERIWRNICHEERAEAEKESRKAGDGKRRQGRSHGIPKGAEFQGLVAGDFQEGTAGTSWRKRESLGGLLARHLSDRDSAFYESYSVPRQPIVHIARPDHYGHETKWREAKLFMKLDSERATFGMSIERGDTPPDDSWHWPRFLRNLRKSDRLTGELKSRMQGLDLHLQWYVWQDGGLVARVFPTDEGWSWQSEQGEDTVSISWQELLGRMESVDEGKWFELHVCRSMTKDEALDLGIQLVDPVVDIYLALIPVYSAAIGEEDRTQE